MVIINFDSKRFNVFLFIVFFLIPFFIWLPTILSGNLFTSGDGISFFTGVYSSAKALLSFEFSSWNPYLAGGAPNAVMYQIFYPFRVIFAFLPFGMFALVYYAFHLAIGGFFTYLYLKEIGVNKYTAIIIALIYELSTHLSGYRKGHMVIIDTIVWLPCILYFIERYLKQRRLVYLLVVVYVMSFQFLLFLQDAFYTAVLVVIYILTFAIKYKQIDTKFIKDAVIASIVFLMFVSVVLVTMGALLLEYKSAGAINPGIGYFKTFSISFSKLLMVLSPEVFQSVYQPSFPSPAFSSDMDGEMFMGTTILFFAIYTVIRYFKDFRVKVILIILCVTYIIAAHAHVPYLSDTLYSIPFVGGFRATARILFIFYFLFFILASISLSKLADKNIIVGVWEDIKSILLIAIIVFCVIFFTHYIMGINISLTFQNGAISNKILFIGILKTIFIPSLIVLILYIALNMFVYLFKNKQTKLQFFFEYKKVYIIALLLVFAVTEAETLRFSLMSAPSNIAKETKIDNTEFGQSKIWVASPYGEYQSTFFGLSKGTFLKIMSINAYASINNTRLYRIFNNGNLSQYNLSELFTFFPNAFNILIHHNDLLSMLDVKYIVDPRNYLDNRTHISTLTTQDSLLFSEDRVTLLPVHEPWKIAHYGFNFHDNVSYNVELDINTKRSPQTFYVDFVGAPTYDFDDQNLFFSLQKELSTYNGIINVGTIPDMTYNKGVRIISTNDGDFTVKSINIYQMYKTPIPSPYEYYQDRDGYKWYINKSAKGILYSPEYVRSIASVEDIYTNLPKHNLLSTAYIENSPVTLDNSRKDTQIEVVKFWDNGITAKVNSSSDTFVNFAQCYFPGWRGYVDGKRVDVHMVNGLIMGMFVPEGDHIIEFKFVFMPFYIACVLYIIAFCFSLFIVIKSFAFKMWRFID